MTNWQISEVTPQAWAKTRLLRPCRATYRPIYWVKELERFLKDNSAADYMLAESSHYGLPGQKAKQPNAVFHPRSNFPVVPPPTAGNSQKTADSTKG